MSLSDLEAMTAGLDARTRSLENVASEHEARLSAVEESIDGNISQSYAVVILSSSLVKWCMNKCQFKDPRTRTCQIEFGRLSLRP